MNQKVVMTFVAEAQMC